VVVAQSLTPAVASTEIKNSTSSLSLAPRISLLALVCLIYLVVSGGAYGIEDAVGIAGPRLTLLLCAVIPFTLSLPTALMAAELTALIPTEGGFYFWVKEAIGPFAGFAEAYLTLLFAAVDTAIYPVLFATYLSFVIPLGPGGQVVLGIALIWCGGLLNLLGVKIVNRTSVGFTVALLTPFVAMVIIGTPRLIHWRMPIEPVQPHRLLEALGGGLTVVMWNFSGWENLSVVAGEIEAPQRNYLHAILIAVPLVTLGYLLPLGVTLSGASTASQWRTGWFAAAGRQLGGEFLEAAIGAGGAVSALAMFEAAILWISRMPFVLARERYLPSALAAFSETRRVPSRAIVACCAVFTLLVPLGFMNLVVLDVFFYMLALVFEMIALVRLRRLRPHRRGLFVISGGTLGVYVVAAAPLLTWLATFGLILSGGARRSDLVAAIVLAIAALPAYVCLRSIYGGPR
jgi:amino acid transporter